MKPRAARRCDPAIATLGRAAHAPGAWCAGAAMRDRRRRRAGARAVHDQHRHGRRDRHRHPGQGTGAWPARSWCASPSTRPRRPQAVPHIREQLDRMGIDVPLIGDFHYNGHRLLTDYPAMRRGAVQVPHQPGQRRQGRQARPPVRADDRSGRCATTRWCASASTGAASTRNCWPQLMDDNAAPRRALGRQAGDVPGAGARRR